MLCASHLHLTLLCLAFNIVWLWLLLYLVMGSFPLQGLGLWRIETKKIDLRKTVLCWNSVEIVRRYIGEEAKDLTALFWCAYTARGILEYLPITRSWFAAELSRCLDKMADVNSVDLIKNALFMPRLAICSRDLHGHWINWTLLCDTMEVSMLRLAWLTTAQHVFQPALTGRLELVSRKIVSRGPRTKAIAVSKFREKLSPANWIQGVTAISRKISRSWAAKNGVQHATAIYPIPWYTRPRYIGLTLYIDI